MRPAVFVAALAFSCGAPAPPPKDAPPPPTPPARETTKATCDPHCPLAVQVSASQENTCAKLASGRVICWGGDSASFAPRYVPDLDDAVRVSASPNESCALRRGGEVACWRRGPAKRVETIEHAVAVAAVGHACAVLATGSVRCWGVGESGQLGNGKTEFGKTPVDVAGIDDAVDVAVGGASTCVLRKGGAVACFGKNASGEVGDGTREMRSSPVVVKGIEGAVAIGLGVGRACAVQRSGGVTCWGTGFAESSAMGMMMPMDLWKTPLAPTPLPDVDDAVDVSVSQTYVCARRRGGRVACWGDHARSVEGFDSVVQLSTGPFHACAVRADDTIVCAGQNDYGELARDPKKAFKTPVRMAGLTGVRAMIITGRGSCATMANDRSLCWAHDPTRTEEQRSAERVGEVDARSFDGIVAQAVAGDLQCFIRVDGRVVCATRDGTAEVVGLKDAVELVVGQDFGCARTRLGAVSCWGGVGTFSRVPNAVAGLADVKQIAAAGGGHACAVRKNGRVACWGDNRRGELGIGPKEILTKPIELKGLDDATQVAIGTRYDCAVRKNGHVACWGEDVPKDLASVSDATSIAIGWNACVVRRGGTVWCSSVGDVAGLADVAALYAYSGTYCTRHKDGTASCWGQNDVGQLGIVPFMASARAVPIEIPSP